MVSSAGVQPHDKQSKTAHAIKLEKQMILISQLILDNNLKSNRQKSDLKPLALIR